MLLAGWLQDTPQDAVSGGRPGSAARSRSAGRARSGGGQHADSRMSPATDEENSNIMLLLDAAEELHKTASHDGPEPSTAATHGASAWLAAVAMCKTRWRFSVFPYSLVKALRIRSTSRFGAMTWWPRLDSGKCLLRHAVLRQLHKCCLWQGQVQ